MKRHPIVEELHIPEPKREDVDRIKDDMGEHGWDARYPSIVFQNRILVGNTREQAAKELKIKPIRRTFKGTVEQARAFVLRSELNRRHMTADEQQAVAAARRAEVADLREQGESTRTIADKLGVSQRTVAKDIKATGESGDSPGATVKGRDGKTYAARVDNRCGVCKRKLPGSQMSVKGCEACKRIKAERAAATKGRTEPGTHEPKRPSRISGKVAFDWRPFRDGFGQCMRQIDTFGRLYHVKDAPAAEALRDQLAAWRTSFVEWTRTVSGTSAPAI